MMRSMGRIGSRVSSATGRLLLVLACGLLAAGFRIGDPGPLFDDPAGVVEAIGRVKESAGGRLRALKIEIEQRRLTVQVQNPANRRAIDEWRTEHVSVAGIHWDRVHGPAPVQPNLVNPDLEANLFNLDDIDFNVVATLTRNAVERAGLEERARVTRIEIMRTVSILPAPASGDVRWSVQVSSSRESARVFADVKGTITGVDLAGTNRARDLDLLTRPELVSDAAKAFRTAIGADARLVHVSIGSHAVSFRTNSADPNFPIPLSGSLSARASYTWNLNGLQRAIGSVSVDAGLPLQDAPFSVDDVDWTVLPKLMAAAKERLRMPQGRVTGAEISRPTQGVGEPVALWTIEVTDTNREKGTIRADARGVVADVTLPESRRPPIDWYDPATMVQMLDRIGREFGNGAKFSEITFMNDKVVIVAPDPRQPQAFVQVLLMKDGFSRFGSPGMLATMQTPFALADLQPLTAPKLAELQSATLTRLSLPPRSISSITLGRGSMDPSPRGNVTIEIRAEDRPFGRSGRVNYELDGRELKAYLP